MSRIICIGDPHFKVTNIEETNKCVERLLEIVRDKNPDFVVILGDLLHEHEKLHTLALNCAVNFVEEVSKLCLTFVLVGNHDMINHHQFLTKNHWMNSMKPWKNVYIVDYPMIFMHNEMKFVFAPYVNNGRFEECLDKVGEWKDAACIFPHQEFYGCNFGHMPSTNGDKWEEEYPHVISGHIHSRQMVGSNVYYPGSVMQHAFGESEKNIIAYVTFNKGVKDYELEEIDLGLPRKRSVKIPISDIDDYEIPETQDSIRFIAEGTAEEFDIFRKSDKYKKIMENPKIKIKYRSVIEEPSDNIGNTELSKSNFMELLKEAIIKDKDYPDELMSDFNHLFLGDNKDDDVLLI